MAIDYASIIVFLQAFLEFLKSIDIMIFVEITLNQLWVFLLLSLAGSAVNGLDYFRDGLTKNEIILIITGAIIAGFFALVFYCTGYVDAFYMPVIGFVAPFIWVRLVSKFKDFFSANGGTVPSGEQESEDASIPSETNPIIISDPPAIEELPNPAEELLKKAIEEAKAEA